MEDIDKDGLTILKSEKIGKTINPYYLNYDNQFYDLRNKYLEDIDNHLYQIIINECKKNNILRIRLKNSMKKNNEILEFASLNEIKVDLENLSKYFKKYEKTTSVTYDVNNQSKFILIIEPEKCFIHIYEFKSNNIECSSKYIHCIFNPTNNVIEHMDYSYNLYDKENYKKIITNPYCREKRANEHIKIWRLDGNISINDFYIIVCKMFKSNAKYIEEFFKE